MFAEFKHTIRRMRGAMIGWGIGLFLYGLMMIAFYSSLDEMGAQFMELLENYPKELLAFFPNITEFATPKGYMDTYFFAYMPIIVGIFSISACAGLLVGDEEKGILDLVMSHPVSRTGIFLGRLLGFVAVTSVILLGGWLGWVLPSGTSDFPLTALEVLQPFLPLLAILLLFGTLTLMFSMLLPSGRLAGALSGAVLVANFLLIGLSGLNPDLEPIYQLTPLYFHQGGAAIEGINWGWLAGLFVVAILFALVAWIRFQRRDIRVGGEGGWGLPDFKALLSRS
jgi:ABC-2 type transport system permease protein